MTRFSNVRRHARIQNGKPTQVREHVRTVPVDPRADLARPSSGYRAWVEGAEHAKLALADLDANIDHNEWDPTMDPVGGQMLNDIESEEQLMRALDAMAHDIVEPGEVDDQVRISAIEHVKAALRDRIRYWEEHTGVRMVASPTARQVHVYPDDSPSPLYMDPNMLRLSGGRLRQSERTPGRWHSRPNEQYYDMGNGNMYSVQVDAMDVNRMDLYRYRPGAKPEHLGQFNDIVAAKRHAVSHMRQQEADE